MPLRSPAPRTEPGPSDPQALDRSFVKGIAWTAGARWATQLLAWVGTLVVARLLVPEDFGLVTIAEVYLGLIMLVSEFGIGTAVITLRELSEEDIGQLNATSVLLGLAACLATAAVARPLAQFFRSPALAPVLVVMGVGFVITSLRAVPAALLQREMQFRTLAFADLVRGATIPFATVLFALLGMRYWALVLGAILSSVIGTVLILRARPHGFRRPRLSRLTAALRFSWEVLVARLAWYGYSNADFVVAGRFLGPAKLGGYSLAWTLAIAAKITSVMSTVVPGLFSAIQADLSVLRRYVLNLSEGLAFVTFPLAAGLALVAEDFVLLALGAKWQAAIVPLRLLAIYTCVRSIVPVLPHVLNVTRDTRFAMRMGLLSVTVMPLAFYIGSRWGIVGIAAVWMLVHPLIVLPTFRRVFRTLDIAVGSYLRALRPGLDGSLLMAAAVLAGQRFVWASWPLAARFAVEVATGVVVFIVTTLVLHRQRLGALYGRVRLAWKPAPVGGEA
jgi:PST family polysaccharide transporter